MTVKLGGRREVQKPPNSAVPASRRKTGPVSALARLLGIGD